MKSLNVIAFAVMVFTTSKASVAKPIQILNMDLMNDEVVVTNDDTRKLEDGDVICFYRGPIEIACGSVIHTTPFDANVKLSSSSEKINAERTETDNDSGSYVEVVFERIELEKTDRAEFKKAHEKTAADLTNKTLLEGLVQLRRSVASTRDNLYGKEDLLNEIEEKKTGIDDAYHHNLFSNISAGVNYIFPSFSYQQAIWNNIVVSLNPMFINIPSGTSSVSGYGTYLTLNHYGIEPFHGDWVQLGVGYLDLSDGLLDWKTPAIMSSAGWRWFWGEGMNFGVGLGIQYTLSSPPAGSTATFSGLLPCVILDFGLAF